MKSYIITGTTSGLGKSLVERLITRGDQVFCLSRRKGDDLPGEAKQIICDMSNPEGLSGIMESIFSNLEADKIESLALINNAGVLDPICPIEFAESSDIINNFSVNLIAPTILTSCFIRLSKEFSCSKTVLNISSGAGKKPYHGWSTYCASKSGLDLFTKAVGVEQQNAKNPVRILSFAPGVIDTKMQARIRACDKEDFASLDRFLALKKEEKLLSAEKVAEVALDFMENQDVEQGGIYDISQFL